MNIKSDLAKYDLQAAKGNYTKGRKGKKIKKITIHHAVMKKVNSKEIAKVFTNPKRKASANYCIGYDGDICCSLYEENRAWTTSSSKNDLQAITMEVSNKSIKPPYEISNKTLESIINLCVDICKRYNFKLIWTGDKNGTLTVHRFFANTTCPGEYLMSKMPYIADEVNNRLEKDTFTSGKYKILNNKYLRKTTDINTKNYVKYNNLKNATKKQCISKDGKAQFKKDATITITKIINKDGRIWGVYANSDIYVVLKDKKGVNQAIKVS